MMNPGGPPRINPRERRPGRVWYALAGAMMLFAGWAMLGLVLLEVGSIFMNVPKMSPVFEAGASTPVQLSTDKQWAIYVEDTSDSDDPPRIGVRCSGTALDGSGTIDLKPVPYLLGLSEDNTTWQMAYQVRVNQAGRYQLTCNPTSSAAGQGRYAIGEKPRIFGTVLTVVIVLLALACVFILGIVIAVVTGIRRSSHQHRLQLERTMRFTIPTGRPGP